MSLLSDLFDGCADAFGAVEARAYDLIEESDPSTALELLPEYETELELDSTGTLAERQARVLARTIARQRYRPVDFQAALAPLFGQDAEDVVIIETRIWRLTKTGGVNATFDAGASSIQTLDGDGFVEWTVDTITQTRWVGLSLSSAALSMDPLTFDYAIRFDVSDYSAYENGTLKQSATGAVVGDRLRIQRTGTTITFLRNGAVYYTSVTASSGSLRIDIGISTSSAKVEALRMYDAAKKAYRTLSWQNITNVTPALALTNDVREVYRFFAFRDPALGGSWYIDSAQDLIDTIKASHTLGFAIERTTALYGDPYTLYGRDIMGPS